MLTKNSKGGLLSLTSKTLLNVVNDKRNYSTIIYFGSASAQQQCHYCSVVEPQFRSLFKEYRNYLGSSGYSSPKFLNNPIFFAICNIPDCTEAAVLSGLQTIPQVSHLDSKSSQSGKEGNYHLNHANLGTGNADIYTLSSFVEQATGTLVSNHLY